MKSQSQFEWIIFGESIQGSSHIFTSTCNQDAVHWLPEKPGKLPITISVSDGHGSAQYFRSGLGAKMAVLAAEKTITELIAPLAYAIDGEKISEMEAFQENKKVKDYVVNKLNKRIRRNWFGFLDYFMNFETKNHNLKNNLFSNEIKEAESGKKSNPIKFLQEEKQVKTPISKQNYQYIPYGATLLNCSITDQFAIYFQIGDGNISCITNTGSFYNPFEGRLNDMVANETCSLISDDYEKRTLVAFESYVMTGKTPPAVVILSTDGLANAFENEKGFKKFIYDINLLIKEAANSENFHETVNKIIADKLHHWSKAASKYSGDDVTIVMAIRKSAYLE